MELRVRAMGRCGITSDRASTDKSVYGIASEGPCWAVDARVENSNSRQLREGSIARYWSTHQTCRSRRRTDSSRAAFLQRHRAPVHGSSHNGGGGLLAVTGEEADGDVVEFRFNV